MKDISERLADVGKTIETLEKEIERLRSVVLSLMDLLDEEEPNCCDGYDYDCGCVSPYCEEDDNIVSFEVDSEDSYLLVIDKNKKGKYYIKERINLL